MVAVSESYTGNPAQRARGLVRGADSADAAGRKERAREVEDYIRPQGTRHETPQIFQRSLWLHVKRQRSARVRVGRSQGRRRDWGRPLRLDRPGESGEFQRQSGKPRDTLNNSITNTAHEVSGGRNVNDHFAIPILIKAVVR